MHYLKVFSHFLAKIERTVLVLLLFSVVTLGLAQIILRNFFSIGFEFGDNALRVLVLWIAFVGASLATYENKHIKIDALYAVLPGRLKRYAHHLSDLAGLVVSIFLVMASYRFIISEKEMGSIAFSQIPTWVVGIIIPSGFLFIAIRFLVHLFEDILLDVSYQDPKEDQE
jgi:TRAP-type C4-dicarboxylate transport system permease small subunit